MPNSSKNSQSALILGASSGMGLACARKLAQEGFDLILVYRCRKKEAREVEQTFDEWRQSGTKIHSYNRDVVADENIKVLIEDIKSKKIKINTLIHSIAKGSLRSMLPVKEDEEKLLGPDDMAITLQSMATSYFSWAQALFTHNLLAAGASLMALTSEGARRAWKNYGAVAAAKSALEAISRNLALELAPHGHRSNILQPGITNTRALQLIPDSGELKKQGKQRNPYGRLTTPEDVANVVYLLSRPEAEWVNGAIIPVDGGENIA